MKFFVKQILLAFLIIILGSILVIGLYLVYQKIMVPAENVRVAIGSLVILAILGTALALFKVTELKEN